MTGDAGDRVEGLFVGPDLVCVGVTVDDQAVVAPNRSRAGDIPGAR